jgi:dTDP-4-dehydrorhamnose 3,5-epimerase
MGAMKIHGTPLAGLVLVETVSVGDERGRFTRLFCESEFSELRPQLHWTQMNLSKTSYKGTVRGMHFQHPPSAEAKLIRCICGKIFDVAVDLRADSPTFLHWYAAELSDSNSMQIFIPEGFAHGFQTLADDVELLYLHTTAWNQELEGGLRHDDPKLGILWPLPVTQVSEKDRNAPLLTDRFTGVHV